MRSGGVGWGGGGGAAQSFSEKGGHYYSCSPTLSNISTIKRRTTYLGRYAALRGGVTNTPIGLGYPL